MRAVLYILLLALPGALAAQDLTGTWKGSVTQGVYVYYYEIRITGSIEGTLSGTTYIQNTGRGIAGTALDHGTMVFKGSVTNKTVAIHEVSLQRQKMSSTNWYWCLKQADLNLTQSGDSLWLVGRWTSDNCTPGRIRVSKPVTPIVLAQTPAPQATSYDFTLNRKTTFENVLFKQSTSDLLPESFPAINAICDYLLHNPAVTIKILGHTDRIGREQGNKILSLERAETVKHYIAGKGIAPARISAAGFGSDSLVCSAPCIQNRRVEFILLK